MNMDNNVIDSLRGLFEGGNFTNIQINIIPGDGAQISYEAPKKEVGKMSDSSMEQGKGAIMEYVGRLKPVVKKEFQEQYDLIWDGILELNQVKAMIYKKGKQQDTSFNRNLLAKIIHQVDYLYIPSTNTVQMASYLEPEKGIDHPVRQKLGEVPEKSIKNAVDEYMKDKL